MHVQIRSRFFLRRRQIWDYVFFTTVHFCNSCGERFNSCWFLSTMSLVDEQTCTGEDTLRRYGSSRYTQDFPGHKFDRRETLFVLLPPHQGIYVWLTLLHHVIVQLVRRRLPFRGWSDGDASLVSLLFGLEPTVLGALRPCEIPASLLLSSSVRGIWSSGVCTGSPGETPPSEMTLLSPCRMACIDVWALRWWHPWPCRRWGCRLRSSQAVL